MFHRLFFQEVEALNTTRTLVRSRTNVASKNNTAHPGAQKWQHAHAHQPALHRALPTYFVPFDFLVKTLCDLIASREELTCMNWTSCPPYPWWTACLGCVGDFQQNWNRKASKLRHKSVDSQSTKIVAIAHRPATISLRLIFPKETRQPKSRTAEIFTLRIFRFELQTSGNLNQGNVKITRICDGWLRTFGLVASICHLFQWCPECVDSSLTKKADKTTFNRWRNWIRRSEWLRSRLNWLSFPTWWRRMFPSRYVCVGMFLFWLVFKIFFHFLKFDKTHC